MVLHRPIEITTAIVPNDRLSFRGPVACPNCSRQLKYSRWQLNLSGLIALVLTAIACWGFGMRGFLFFASTIVLWFPVYVVWDLIFLRLVPPALEAYRDEDLRPSRRK
jgi:hypothetical protein